MRATVRSSKKKSSNSSNSNSSSSMTKQNKSFEEEEDAEAGDATGVEKAPLMLESHVVVENSAQNLLIEKAADLKDAAFWLFMLFLASVTMTVGNKFVMKQWGDYANTLTLLQNGTAVIYLGAGHALGLLEMKAFAAQQWKVFAVSSFFLSMQILTSLKALPFVAIATVVAFRNMCTVVIALIDFFCFGNKFSKPQLYALALTTAGMVLYALQDINFNAVGYLWLVGNSVATIVNTFWNKVYITKYTKELKIQTSYGVSFIQQVETIPIAFILATMNKEGGAFSAFGPLPGSAKAMVVATMAGGVLIGIAYPKCFSLVSGTSVVVASTANKAVSILIGMWLFGTRLSWLQILGLLVCITGSLWYAVEGKKPKR
jgi:drug/metabolite transporter (DMT)-like permease